MVGKKYIILLLSLLGLSATLRDAQASRVFVETTAPPSSTPMSATIRPIPSPLTGSRLAMCKAREAVIQERSQHAVAQAHHMLNVFDRIAQRVSTYSVSRQALPKIPSNPSLASPQPVTQLLDNLSIQRTAAHEALSLAEQATGTFSCSDAPRERLAQFHQHIKAVHTALADYRTAVKNLITTVRASAPKISPSPASPTPRSLPLIQF